MLFDSSDYALIFSCRNRFYEDVRLSIGSAREEWPNALIVLSTYQSIPKVWEQEQAVCKEFGAVALRWKRKLPWCKQYVINLGYKWMRANSPRSWVGVVDCDIVWGNGLRKWMEETMDEQTAVRMTETRHGERGCRGGKHGDPQVARLIGEMPKDDPAKAKEWLLKFVDLQFGDRPNEPVGAVGYNLSFHHNIFDTIGGQEEGLVGYINDDRDLCESILSHKFGLKIAPRRCMSHHINHPAYMRMSKNKAIAECRRQRKAAFARGEVIKGNAGREWGVGNLLEIHDFS